MSEFTLGHVFLEERKTNDMARKNLSEAGNGCKVQDIDVQSIMNEFKEKKPEAYSSLLKSNPAREEVNGQLKAPNIDVQTGALEADEKLKPGAELKKFVSEQPFWKEVSGIFGPGDYNNVVGKNVSENPDRMYFEKALYQVAQDKGMPVLGVCGSEQHVAYFAGANVVENVKELTGHDHNRSVNGQTSGRIHSHGIILTEDAATLKGLVRDSDGNRSSDQNIEPKVNSLHYQAVLADDKNKDILDKAGFHITALDESKQIVEAMESKSGTPVVLTQFHPEFANNDFAKDILKAFAGAAETYAKKSEVNRQVKKIVPRIKAERMPESNDSIRKILANGSKKTRETDNNTGLSR